MSYSLILLRVPPGSTDDDVERAVQAANDAESRRPPGPIDEEAERLKRRLADALLAECPELTGGELDYATIARAEKISEEAARKEFRWWVLTGPDEGAGIEIILYDAYVDIEMAAGGTDEDWEDVWRYVDILVREGGFVIWDPQGPNVVERPPPKRARGEKKRREKAPAKRNEDASDVEPEDERRGGEVAKLVTRIVDEAIARPLANAGYRRSGRTWRRFLDDGTIQVVNVQWSLRHEGEAWFTLNAGAYFPALAASLALFPVTKTPKEFDCHVRKRPLLPGVSGWQVRVPGAAKADPDLGEGVVGKFFSWLDRRADRKAPEQHERATRELRESLERVGLPWLEQVSTLRGARDELVRTHYLFVAAHASLLLNDRDEAARLVERELAKSKSNPEYSETVREWARANGLAA
jgi:hypothetical protein